MMQCKKIKIAIVTFHRVYNYGAVIQAYALQKIIESYGYKTEILDFSQEKQRDFTDVISKKNGVKRFIKTLILFPVLRKRKIRKHRFDDFINNHMVTSKRLYQNEDELKKADNLYNVYVCGSDQIWNPLKKSDFNPAYMLSFSSKKKIAYAPSIGSATADELEKYAEYLKKFSALSCREEGGASIISKVTNCDVKVVLDPTLLVDKSEIIKLTSTKEEPYIFYYSLDGYENKDRNMDILKKLAKKFKLKIKMITPEWPFHRNIGEDVIDAGPVEFLSLIRNASLICTNSFHGTALSIELEKPFFVLENPEIKDERKRSLLKQLGLQDRILSVVDEINHINQYSIDYESISQQLEMLRKESEEYLLNALRG